MDNNKICDHYKCIMSVGMRCFTGIFLKAMNLKNFSGVFDGMYNTKVSDIIDIMKNEIVSNELIYTETINNDIIRKMNETIGYRTIHRRCNYKPDDLIYSYHHAFLPHHNLNNIKDVSHFDRCFTRLNKIKSNKVRTLFCLFIHPEYSTDCDIPYKDIEKLKIFLIANYNCKLLVCKFKKQHNNYKWKCLINDEFITYIHVNNSSVEFNDVQTEMNEIMTYMHVNQPNLITYDGIDIL